MKRSAKKAIKKSERNWPVRKSIRIRKAATAPNKKESGALTDHGDNTIGYLDDDQFVAWCEGQHGITYERLRDGEEFSVRGRRVDVSDLYGMFSAELAWREHTGLQANEPNA